MSDKEIKANNDGIAVDNSGVGNKPTININKAAKYSSLLNPLLEKIVKNYDPDSEIENHGELPDPDEKIKFNDVNIFSDEIEECVGFLSVVEEQIDIIDDEEPDSKNKFMRAISQKYKEKKREILIEKSIDANNPHDVIAVIRDNADKIIQAVSDAILEYAEKDLHSYSVEEVKDSISLIVCYGFINCKILERPNDYQ